MRRKRKALFLASTAATIVIIIVGIALLAQTPSAPEESPVEELPTEGTPPNLLVIPEVPLGTLAIILACFFALIISQMKPKAKLQ